LTAIVNTCVYTQCVQQTLYTVLVVIYLILEMLEGEAKYSVLEVPCLIAKIMMGNICMI